MVEIGYSKELSLIGFLLIVLGVILTYKICIFKIRRIVILCLLLILLSGFFIFLTSSHRLDKAIWLGKPLDKSELLQEKEFIIIFSSPVFSIVKTENNCDNESDVRIVAGLPVMPQGTVFFVKDNEVYTLVPLKEKKIEL